MTRISRRPVLSTLAAIAATIAFPSIARAQAGALGGERRFTVVSEMARELSIVSYQDAIGSRLSNNVRQRVPLANGALDRVALSTTRAAIQRALPVSQVSLVAPLDEDLFPDLSRAAVGDDARIPADLKDVLAQHRSTELLVWTPLRSDSRIRGADSGDLGSGQLEGLGLYVDSKRDILVVNTGGTQGFIAPFMHARATLVQIAGAKVQRAERIELGIPYTALDSGKPTGDVFTSFTTDEKLRMISALMTAQIEAVVPRLLA